MVFGIILGSYFISYTTGHWHGTQTGSTDQRINFLFAEDIENFKKDYPTVENIMLGRGILKTPSLMKELEGESRNLKKWYEFLSELCEEYGKELSGDTNVLYKMKEHWYYLFQSLPKDEKAVKAMRKIKHLDEYRILVKSILCQ